MSIRGQVEAPRTGVEPAREVHDEVDLFAPDEVENHLVEYGGARDHRPRQRPALVELVDDRLAALPGKPAGERIAEDRVRSLRLHRAIDGHPSGRVRNVFDRHCYSPVRNVIARSGIPRKYVTTHARSPVRSTPTKAGVPPM